jgi:hypothetical protein
MTVEGWPDLARGVMAPSADAWICVVVSRLIATFMVLTLCIAVVVNAVLPKCALLESIAEAANRRERRVFTPSGDETDGRLPGR